MNCLLWTEKKLQESGIFVKIFLKLMLNQHELMCNTPELNFCSTVWVKTDLAVIVYLSFFYFEAFINLVSN